MSVFIGNQTHEGGNDAVGGAPRGAEQRQVASRSKQILALVALLALALGGCGAALEGVNAGLTLWNLMCGDPTCGLDMTIQSPPDPRASCPDGFVRVTETPTTGAARSPGPPGCARRRPMNRVALARTTGALR